MVTQFFNAIVLIQFLHFVLFYNWTWVLYRRGKDRRLSVEKVKGKGDSDSGPGRLPHFTFSKDSKRVLDDLFARYPPGDGNLKDMIGESSGSNDSARQKKDDIFCRPSMTKAEIAKKFEALTSRTKNVPNLKQVHFSTFPINFKDTVVYEFC